MKKISYYLGGLSLTAIALVGCTVTTHDGDGGGKKDVDIKTPLGSISVKKGSTDIKETGLPAYPGARLKGDSDGDENANVNISSSVFGLKVVAAKFESSDPPEKVLGFYRKEMGKYGSVLACTGDFNLVFHRRDKNSEVTCENSGGGHQYREELKVGTENNQRIVAIKPAGGGSEFSVVYVRTWDEHDTI